MSVPTEFVYLLDEVKVFKRNLVKDNSQKRQKEKYNLRKLSKFKNYKLELGTIRERFNAKVNEPKLINRVREYIQQIEQYLKASQDILQFRLGDIKIAGKESEILVSSDSDSENFDEVTTKMAQKFDPKTASSLLPVMDGSETVTLQLINGIEWYDALLDDAGKLLLTTYVLKTRLSGSANIRLKSSYASNQLLVTDLRCHFITKKSATALSSKLNNIKQGSKSVEEFGKTIEELMVDLTIAQSGGNSGVMDILRPVNEKIGISSFANGLQNYSLRTIIKARNYDTLSEAICGAKDECLGETTPKPLFHMRGRGDNYESQQFRHYNIRRGQNTNFRSNRGVNNFGITNNNFRGYFSRGQQGNTRFRGRGSRPSSSYTPRGQYNNRGRFIGTNTNQRAYYMNSEESNDTNSNQNYFQNNNETFFRGPPK